MILAPVALALLTAVGTLIGVLALAGVSPVTVAGSVLAFGAVAFMYLASEELLVQAHERGKPPWAASGSSSAS